MQLCPSHQADELAARFVLPSSSSVDSSNTGVP